MLTEDELRVKVSELVAYARDHISMNAENRIYVTNILLDFFNLTYITNTGAAWGILAGHGWLLLLISCAVLIAVICFIRTLTDGWPERIYAIGLIVSGILGNSIDRIFRGEVVDFLQFLFGRYQYPSFNVADSCICVGVFLFILSTILRPEKKKTPSDSSYVQIQK